MKNELGSFTDSRDGKIYKTVKIGNQVWLAENLAFEISGKECRDDENWEESSNNDKWCYYDNDKSEYGKFGILYQWEAAQKACPSGWHLPSDNEWKELEIYLGMSSSDANKHSFRGNIAKKLASKTGWESNIEAGTIGNNQSSNNTSGFCAPPSGRRSSSGSFTMVGSWGFWWSSSSAGNEYAWGRDLLSTHDGVERNGGHYGSGFSVRCIMD